MTCSGSECFMDPGTKFRFNKTSFRMSATSFPRITPRPSVLAEVQQPRLRDCGVRPDRFQDGPRYLAIHPHQGDGFGPPRSFAAPQRKRGNVYAMLPQGRPDIADHSRFIVVPKVQYGTLQFGFQRDSINVDHAWRTIMEYGAFRAESRRAFLIRHRSHFQRMRKAVLPPTRLFFDD